MTEMNEPIELETHPTHKEQAVHGVVWFILLVAVVMCALMSFWLISGKDVLVIKNSPFPVRTIRPHPQADGVVFLKVDYCKVQKATGRVRVSFVGDSREIFAPVSEESGSPKCENREIPVAIPHDIVPGKYKVHFRITYQPNPIRTVIEEFDSQPFEIVSATGDNTVQSGPQGIQGFQGVQGEQGIPGTPAPKQ